MEKLIGVVVSPDIRAEIIDFGKKHNCTIVDPHIALVPHDMLKGGKGLDRNLQSFCLLQPPLKAIIGGPKIEINEDSEMFFLTVMMGSLNSARDRLIKHFKLPPYSGVFRPCVSLIEQKKGGAHDFEKMLAEAKTVFSKPRPISIDELAIYTRSNENEPYRMDTSYTFTGR